MDVFNLGCNFNLYNEWMLNFTYFPVKLLSNINLKSNFSNNNANIIGNFHFVHLHLWFLLLTIEIDPKYF